MRYILILLICLLIAPTVSAADKTLKQNKTKSKKIATSWKPVAFDDTAQRLPANYSGLNPISFYNMYKGKVDKLEKGKYETSEEFERRIADKDALLAPITTSDLYAFRMEDIAVQYDADAKSYKVGDVSFIGNYSCKETRSLKTEKEEITCKVTSISRQNSTYTGSNAYGASRTVKRIKGLDFALAIPKSSPAFSQVFSKDPSDYKSFIYYYRDNLSVPLEKAREIREDLSVLFVGRVSDAKIVTGRETYRDPTIDSPNDTMIYQNAVPFDLNKIIYYVRKTGEILYVKSFRQENP